MNDELDNIFYRVERDGEWQNVCFSDLTEEEREKLTDDYGAEQWKRVAIHLADMIHVAYQLGKEGK